MKTQERVRKPRSRDQLTLALTEEGPMEHMDADARTRAVAAVAQVLLAAHRSNAEEAIDDAR